MYPAPLWSPTYICPPPRLKRFPFVVPLPITSPGPRYSSSRFSKFETFPLMEPPALICEAPIARELLSLLQFSVVSHRHFPNADGTISPAGHQQLPIRRKQELRWSRVR